MNNMINDKLVASTNVHFTPGEEISLTAYMTGNVKNFQTMDGDGVVTNFTFIDGQTFESAIVAGRDQGVNVCKKMSISMEINNEEIHSTMHWFQSLRLCYDESGVDPVGIYDSILPNTMMYWCQVEEEPEPELT